MIRENTAAAPTPNNILLSKGEILLPEVPVNTRRSDVNGLITSALTGGVQKPDGRILLPNEEQVAALAVNADGKIVEQAQAPKGNRILLPSEDEVGKLSVVGGTEKEDKEKSEKQALLFYISQPWSYLNNRLEQVGLVSPVGEMQGQIDEFRANAPKISQASKTLLRSPIKSIREMEKRRLLLDDDISEAEYQAAIAPDIALIDVSNLDFISEELEGGSLDGFYDFLSTSIDELFDISASGSERVRHLADVCQKLNLITQAFLYKSGNFKLDNAALLEKVTSKLEFLTTGEFKNSTRYLQPLFDFLSYFEMNNSSASSYLLEILEANNYKHPLINELIYQLNPEERVDKDQPKIGIEVEAIPSVLFGNIPHGFEMGVDGGMTMPEMRREKKDIQFDLTHKKDLYDFWYFAKMTQLRGASVHIHIDDSQEIKFSLFKKLFGFNSDTIRRSDFGTVELRFNLSSYGHQDGLTYSSLNMSTPFFHEQFDLTSFIEALMEYADTQSISDETMSSLPDFWKLRVEKAKPISFDEFMEISEEEMWDRTETISALKRLRGALSLEQAIEISEENEWDNDVIEQAFERANVKLSLKQTMEIAKKYGWDGDLISGLLNKTDGILSLEQAMDLSEKSGWNYSAIEQAFKKLDEALSLEQVLKALEDSKWKWMIIYPILKKFDGELSSEQVMKMSEKSEWGGNAVMLALKKLDGTLSLEQVLRISRKSERYVDIIKLAFEKLDETLSLEQILKILKEYDWNENIVNQAFEKLNKKLSLNQVLNISRGHNWNTDVVENAFKKLKWDLSNTKVIEILEESGWKYPTIITVLKKIKKILSPRQTTYILKKYGWNRYVIKQVFEKLKEKLSLEETIKMLEESSWDHGLLNYIFNEMDGTLSLKQVMEIVERSNWNQNAIYYSFEKLDGTLSLEQVMEITEKSGLNRSIMEIALEKMKGTLSLEQVMEIVRKSNLNSEVIEQAFEKLDGALSFEQVMEIPRKTAQEPYPNKELVKIALKKLDGKFSLEQAIYASRKSGWNSKVINKVFDNLNEKISFEQIIELISDGVMDEDVMKQVFEKLDRMLSLEEFLKVLEESNWEFEILEFLLEKLEKKESHNLELLKDVPENKQLLIWSLLVEGDFEKPIKLKKELF